jgi:heme/copper-type cytochrome/quinol oxidase subunit 4
MNNSFPDDVKNSQSGDLILPLPLAWILSVIATIAPFMIVFNPGDKWSIAGIWSVCCLTIMVLVLVLFLADAIVSKIRYKPVWIVFILLCPTVAQIVYLILRKKILS